MASRVITTADQILADILRDPTDDFPRLVYADWLDDHGESEQAECIRECVTLRCAYVYADAVAKWPAIRRAIQDGLPDGPEWIFRRGFIDQVICTLAQWLTHGEAIVSAHPVEWLAIRDRQPSRECYVTRFSCGSASSWDSAVYRLPPDLWDGVLHLRSALKVSDHWTDAKAMSALGHVALMQARERAGLPLWPWNQTEG